MTTLLHRPVCELLGCTYPLVLAGMGGVARSELAAAVSEAGGFGFLGMVREPVALIRSEVEAMRQRGVQRFGVNLIPAATPAELLEAQLQTCIELEVPVVALFWDLSTQIVSRLRAAGITVVCQIGSVEEAVAARRAGAQVIIAQGCEAGGHVRGSSPLDEILPQVLAAVDCPVLAAGGIVDGRDVATVLTLGADGAVLGTASMTGDFEAMALYSGMGVGRIDVIVGAGERLRTIAAEASAILGAEFADPVDTAEFSSPVCYAETAPEYMGFATRDELLAALNELLEAERAGSRVCLRTAEEATDPDSRSLVENIQRDEAHWCAVLTKAILTLGATPSPRIGSFYEKAMAISTLPERLAFLNRGQGWVVKRLRELTPKVREHAIHRALSNMLASHERNVELVNASLKSPSAET